MKNLLLLSNSRMPGTSYLQHALDPIAETVGNACNVVLIPYASVMKSWDEMTEQVRLALRSLGLDIVGIHQLDDPIKALAEADAIMVNGGNTYRLLQLLRQNELIVPLRTQLLAGKRYVGWSAGSAICAPSIRTSNDMPIVDPAGLDALGVIDFQLNAHYTNVVPEGWMGETRNDRLNEFLKLNPSMPVFGLPEGDWLRVRGDDITLRGPFPGLWFSAGSEPVTVTSGEVLQRPCRLNYTN